MRAGIQIARCGGLLLLIGFAVTAIIEGGGTGCAVPSGFYFDPRILAGDHMVPRVESTGYGYGTYALEEDNTVLGFVITASGLSSPVSGAFLHRVPGGSSGPELLDLSPFLTEVRGEIAIAGTSSLSDWSSDQPLEAIQSGEVYVTIRTEQHPDGEIRGQVTLTE